MTNLMDITDAWNEVVDPENEYGHTVTAVFKGDYVSYASVEYNDRDPKGHLARTSLIRVLGEETVLRIERVWEDEQVNG